MIRIGSNIFSLNAQRRLADTTNLLSDTFERLSSGQRINKASDDAAGLAIASSLNTDKRVFSQGIRNLNDGVSALTIAEGALEALSSIVIRLQELAEQSANGVYGSVQRKSLDQEAQELADEYFRISKTTQFNGLNLLDGTLDQLRLQAGYGVEGGITGGVGGAIGAGSFLEATSYATENYNSFSLALGDLDGDGNLDIVTAGRERFYGAATAHLGAGDGSVRKYASYANETTACSDVVLEDLNSDGLLDMVTAGWIGSSPYDGMATVRLGNGDGSFTSAISYETESHQSIALSTGDVNGDGVLDLVTVGRSDELDGWATVFIGAGNGTFAKTCSYTTEPRMSNDVALVDINSDGALDLITAGQGDFPNYDGFATVRLGAGDGSFGNAVQYSTESGGSNALAIGDINGDGILDLVTAGYSDAPYAGYATVFIGRGDGSFDTAATYASESGWSYDVILGDIDGDRNLDLITAGRSAADEGYATIRRGSGNGTFSAAVSYRTESRLSSAVGLGDFDNDGVVDLVTAGQTSIVSYGYATVRLAETKSGVSPLLPFSLSTMADARQALPVFRQKLEQLASQRGQIGALQSRLSVAMNVLGTTVENSAAAASRIMDADIAQETAQLVRTQILQQAGAMVLSQANQQPALAIQLLRT